MIKESDTWGGMHVGSDGGRVFEPFVAHVLASKQSMDTEGVAGNINSDDDYDDDDDMIDDGVLRTAGLLFSHLLKALQTVDLRTTISGCIVGVVLLCYGLNILDPRRHVCTVPGLLSAALQRRRALASGSPIPPIILMYSIVGR